MKRILLIILIISGLILFGCQTASEPAEESAGNTLLQPAEKEAPDQNEDIPITNPLGFTNELVDGLHVTGTPVKVDINGYRLEVTGNVSNPLSLTFDEIKNMESKRVYAELECPGFFIDEGYWTGVELSTLLDIAGIGADADEVSFISIDGYQRSMSLEDVMANEGMLVAYQFQDKEFPEVHGYPLRIVASGELGSVWVKLLGEIQVLSSDVSD